MVFTASEGVMETGDDDGVTLYSASRIDKDLDGLYNQ